MTLIIRLHRPLVALLLLAACPDGGSTSTGTTAGTAGTDGTSAGTSDAGTQGTTDAPTGTTGNTTVGTTTVTTGEPDPTGSTTDPGPVEDPVFELDIVPILTGSCGAADNACHSRVAYAADVNSDCRGWLALEDVPLGAEYYAGAMQGQPTGCSDLELYMRLLSLDAWQCETFDPRIRYVVPCEPDNSYIVRKIAGGPYCAADNMGQPMPTQPMPLGKVLPAGQIQTIKNWIAAGAPRIDDPGVDCDAGPDPAQDPVPEIFHPGDGETRKVGVPIPFIGVANDPQDGMLADPALAWTSDLDGPLGTGAMFDGTLTTVGLHTITLTATDADNNTGTATITLNMEM